MLLFSNCHVDFPLSSNTNSYHSGTLTSSFIQQYPAISTLTPTSTTSPILTNNSNTTTMPLHPLPFRSRVKPLLILSLNVLNKTTRNKTKVIILCSILAVFVIYKSMQYFQIGHLINRGFEYVFSRREGTCSGEYIGYGGCGADRIGMVRRRPIVSFRRMYEWEECKEIAVFDEGGLGFDDEEEEVWDESEETLSSTEDVCEDRTESESEDENEDKDESESGSESENESEPEIVGELIKCQIDMPWEEERGRTLFRLSTASARTARLTQSRRRNREYTVKEEAEFTDEPEFEEEYEGYERDERDARSPLPKPGTILRVRRLSGEYNIAVVEGVENGMRG